MYSTALAVWAKNKCIVQNQTLSFLVLFFRISSFKTTITMTETKNRLPGRPGLQNIRTPSLQRGKTPPTSVLDMTQNNLMFRLQ